MNPTSRLATLAAIAAAVIATFFPATLLADSLYVAAATGEIVSGTGIVNCNVNSASTASCGSTQATGSLSSGVFGNRSDISSVPPNAQGLTSWTSAAESIPTYNNSVSIGSGSIVYTLDISGTFQILGNPPPPFGASAGISIPTSESFVGVSNIVTTGNDTYAHILPNGTSVIRISTPVSNGMSVFTFNLYTSAICPGLTALQLSQGYSCEAISDFLDPTTIASAAVYDANGNLVPGASIISDSGYSPPTAAPEPSSLFLLSTAIAGLGVTMGRRRDVVPTHSSDLPQ